MMDIGVMIARQINEANMQDRATIYRPPDVASATRAPSGAIESDYPDDWQVVAENARLRIVSATSGIHMGREEFGGGKEQSTTLFDPAFAIGTDIDATCRFRLTDSPSKPDLIGADFDVVSVTPEDSQITVLATRTVKQ